MSENPTLYQVGPEMMNLNSSETNIFNKLLAVWQKHINGNIRNQAYYDGLIKPIWKDSPPKDLKDLNVVIGWGSKAVDTLVNRSVLEGFRSDSDAHNAFIDATGQIDFKDLYRQTITSELIGSCAAITLSKGLKGEPDIIVSSHSALDFAAIWDFRKKRIKYGLVVLDVEEDIDGRRAPSWVTMYTEEATYSCRKVNEKWIAEKADNFLERPLMEPLRYHPTLNRPFGVSRINRTVRSLIDRAMGVAARTEISGTFYTWPQRYMLGVDKKTAESASKRKLETYADKIIYVSTNKNGDVPQYGQLPQMSMQPHNDHLQTLAKQFAGEASLPLNSLGIVFDNPSSAEAMYAAQNDLIIEAERVNSESTTALVNIAKMVLAIKRNSLMRDLSDQDKSVMPKFANPIRPSMAARADFSIKVASAVPEYAQTEQFWVDLGYDQQAIASIQQDIRRAQAQNAIAQLLGGADENKQPNTQ